MQRASLRRLVLDAWPLLVAATLLLPLLTRPGIPLARDLVFVPHQPWTDAVLGLGDAAPRAVPLDALVSLATAVVDGGVLARVVLPLVLATAGWGAHRLVRDLGAPARLAAGGLAVWNPFVVERLALGQWALLAAYAALPWLAMAAVRFRHTGTARDLAPIVLWLGLASITPTGGLLAIAVALVFGLGGPARALRLVPVALVLQLPWLLPALTGGAAVTSDPAGVAAFASRAEGPGGVVTAVLGLGGIWDSGSVPGTRETWWGTAAAAAVVVALVVGGRHLWRAQGGADVGRWTGLAAAGLLLALASSTTVGADALGWAVETVPGAGLLRDSQKFVAWFAVVAVAAIAATLHVVVERVRSWGSEVGLAAAVTAVAVPVFLLPDATGTVWPTVDPVDPSPDLDVVAAVVDGTDRDLVTLPWRSYRRFDWGSDLISSDPAVRWFDVDVVVADDLAVGALTVAGESARAREIGDALEHAPPADVLAPLGVGWVLVYLDDPDADDLDLTGLTQEYAGPDVALYSVPDALSAQDDEADADRWPVLFGDLVAVLILTVAAVVRITSRKRRSEGFPVVR